MKPDLYTKAVLTVIALALSWLCFNSKTQVVKAQSDEFTKVVIVGVHVGKNKNSEALPVKVMGQ